LTRGCGIFVAPHPTTSAGVDVPQDQSSLGPDRPVRPAFECFRQPPERDQCTWPLRDRRISLDRKTDRSSGSRLLGRGWRAVRIPSKAAGGAGAGGRAGAFPVRPSSVYFGGFRSPKLESRKKP
jgi:hypothetical protein